MVTCPSLTLAHLKRQIAYDSHYRTFLPIAGKPQLGAQNNQDNCHSKCGAAVDTLRKANLESDEIIDVPLE